MILPALSAGLTSDSPVNDSRKAAGEYGNGGL
jgi:hypothetical protein